MKVILSYLRTDELDIPPNIRSYDLDRESLFYNIELPKANARNRHRRKIELRKNGIYTSDASFFYFKVSIKKSATNGMILILFFIDIELTYGPSWSRLEIWKQSRETCLLRNPRK
jgi:hypothetical protein